MKGIATIAGETKSGGVLVHCQAGMSRSATVIAAYLMHTLELDPMDAMEMIRYKRPIVEWVDLQIRAVEADECSPSETFWHQLGLFYNTGGRVTLRDRSTRQYYMERTTSQVLSALN